MSDITVTIIWHKENPIALRFDDKLIWETDDVIAETDLLKTEIALPILAAVKFSTIFLQGLVTDRLSILFNALQLKINELRSLEMKDEKQKESEKQKELEEQKEPEKIKDDFYCDKECNRTCADWDKCQPPDEDDDDWNDIEDENDIN